MKEGKKKQKGLKDGGRPVGACACVALFAPLQGYCAVLLVKLELKEDKKNYNSMLKTQKVFLTISTPIMYMLVTQYVTFDYLK